jgi:hypothetical protein
MKVVTFFRRVRITAKSAYCFRRVRLSMRMYQRGPHWTDFHKIWCWQILWNSVEKLQTWPDILYEHQVRFIVWRRNTFAIKSFLFNNTVILLTVTNTSTMHTQRIFMFPLQQRLRERATTLRYAYTIVLLRKERLNCKSNFTKQLEVFQDSVSGVPYLLVRNGSYEELHRHLGTSF